MSKISKLFARKDGEYVDAKERFAFYFSAFFRDMSYAFMGGYLSYFYIDIMGLKGLALSLVLIVCRIFDGIDDPLLGVFYDRRKYTPGNKARPFFKYIMIPGTIIYCFLFFSPTFSDNATTDTVIKVLYAIVTYCMFESMQTINGTAFMSYYNSISPNDDERGKIISVSRLFSTGGSALIGGIVPILLSMFANDDLMAKTRIYFGMGIFVAICFFVYNLIMSKCVKERVTAPPPEVKESIIDMFKKFGKNKLLLLMMLSNTIGGIINAGNTSLYFYTYNMGNPALSTIIGFAGIPSLFIATALVPILIKKLNKRSIMLGCSAMTVICYVVYLIVGYKSIAFLLIYTFIVNIPGGMKGILYWNMIADTIDYAEWKTGVRNDGMVYSIEGFLSKVVGALGSFSTAIIIAVIHFVPNAATQTQETMNGLFYVPLCISIVSTICSAVPYLFYKFTREDQSRVRRELDERKSGKAKLSVAPAELAVPEGADKIVSSFVTEDFDV